ncbi:hypothetical protein KAI65_04215 [Candidatus Parcubacteria bacterium]|nr:hypothetical protein [Candidatus Parcubacteria bacterium]
MKKKLFRNIALIAVFVFLFSASVALDAEKAGAQPDLGFNYANNLNLEVADEDDPREMAVAVVRYLMTFLGIIAVVVMLLGGFKWMTAAGNEDKVAEAKKLIIAGIIGLIIVLCAYAIVQFVVGMTNDLLSDSL